MQNEQDLGKLPIAKTIQTEVIHILAEAIMLINLVIIPQFSTRLFFDKQNSSITVPPLVIVHILSQSNL